MYDLTRFGRSAEVPGFVLREVRPVALALLVARRNQDAELTVAIRRAYGIELPSRPRFVNSGSTSFIWAGPRQWMASADEVPEPFLQRLTGVVGGLASLTDQSDARVIVDVTGPRVREVLAKGFAIDLDAAVFGVGDTAIAPAAHIGAQLWQVAPTPVYRIAVARSYYRSWRRWAEAAAAEYGGVIETPIAAE